MVKCDLHIVLDRSDRAFTIGEKVTGRVEVTPHEDLRCNKLTLLRAWRTRGRGEADFGKPEEQVLFAGSWRDGERTDYPFEFEAPPGPLTYKGELFNVEWHLRAKADIPGALDVAVDEEFMLIGGENPQAFNLGPASRSPASQQHFIQVGQSAARGCLVITAVLFLLLSLGFAAGALSMFQEARTAGPREWSALTVAVLFVAGSGALLAWGLRPIIAQRKLGPVMVQVTPRIVRPGEITTCAIRFQPRADIDLIEAAATLRGMEIVEWRGSKEEGHSRRRLVAEEMVQLAAGRRLMAGESVTLEAGLPVPPKAPPTFVAAHNSLVWLVNVRVRLQGWPDWSRDYAIAIRP